MQKTHTPVPKYVLTHPEAEIKGLSLISLEQSSELEEFADLLDKYGLRGIKGEQYYKLATVMEYYREVMQRPNASTNFVSMGINLHKSVVLPEDVKTIEDGLRLMIYIIKINVIHDPTIETWYQIERIGDRHIRLIDQSPFPHDLLYGYVYGVSRRLAPEGTRPTVRRTFMNEADPDADGAVYDITW